MDPNPILLFMYSKTATLMSIASLLGAIVLFIRNIRELIQEVKNMFRLVRQIIFRGKKEENIKIGQKKLLSIILFLLIIPAMTFTVWAKDPPNVRMMKQVWGAFNRAKESKKTEDYHKAIEKAEALILEFKPGALYRQKELLSNKVEVPKPGRKSEQEKQNIWDFGPLHEVSAAWWVKGRSLEAIGSPQEAMQAYEKASQFPHALVYDPSWKGFWSPAEDAKARIDYLQPIE
jgi:tetratricopeptide (TPR) repeat protein